MYVLLDTFEIYHGKISQSVVQGLNRYAAAATREFGFPKIALKMEINFNDTTSDSPRYVT